MSLQGCAVRAYFLNRPKRVPALPNGGYAARLWILAAVALMALIAGFLAFGGGNMGN